MNLAPSRHQTHWTYRGTETAGRWIIVVIQSEFENAKQWIDDVLNEVPSLMPDIDFTAFDSSYDIFPPCLYTHAPLGGRMQQDSEETYQRIMAKKDRYVSTTKSTKTRTNNNAWSRTNPIFFDATPANSPTLQNPDSGMVTHLPADTTFIASTVKTILTKSCLNNYHRCRYYR